MRGRALNGGVDPDPLRCRDFPRRGKQEKVKSEEVIVKRWKALPVGEGGPLGPGEGRLFFFIYYPFFIL